ncbi:epigen isoform X3 [Prionailurus viverrinus]|uniref:Epigen n=1 Tax=Puma concolor TaxID=9696 RepID=A0A6P6HPI8_PUMCO|nr:epigen isoform X3 [Puma concolor]XP_030167794.1 epigen isoform X3 [Lynx canadensis]XP_042789934.1 epigen isoform X3 [Panthera leo]XP_042838659.1 epigen isoform X3 [Panthera tigris]XP_046948356.1 epigen isoform X3 [Lynx rufus]XP_047712995.1 epigen isoform X3 [Prionailurus viverrinus]
MAFGVPISVYLLFKAMTALTEEAAVTGTPSNTTQQTDYTEGPIALKFSHPCLEDHNSYCINGVCAFHHELEKAICRCFTGYTGERCLKLKSPYNICSGGRPL